MAEENPNFDPNPALRDELDAALAVIAPKIRGLTLLTSSQTSPALHAFLAAQLASYQGRHDRIAAVIATLDDVVDARSALAADGYPATPQTPIPQAEYDELQAELADITAATAIFDFVSMKIDLGSPAEK